MKTFNQFCSEAYQLDENILLNTARRAANTPIGRTIIGRTGLGRAVRGISAATAADEVIQKLPRPVRDIGEIGASGLGMGPLAVPAMAVTAATKLATPVGKRVHKARTERDATARQALSTAPSTRGMTFADRERLVQGTRLKGV